MSASKPTSTPPHAPFLEVRNLTLQYKTNEYLITATHDVNFQVEKSDRLILLGPSGCGKSTILKAIGGFLKPARGSILLDGVEVKKPGFDRAVVFQEFDQLLPWKTALENIVFASRTKQSKEAAEAAVEKSNFLKSLPLRSTLIDFTSLFFYYFKRSIKANALEEAKVLLKKVNLQKFENSYGHALSGGMKQRVAIARCLALKSKVILMDEPFASLDALTRQKMQEELLELWNETKFTLVFVTHSIDEAITLGNRIVMLSPHPGEVVDEIDVELSSLDASYNPEFAELKERISTILFKDQLDYVI